MAAFFLPFLEAKKRTLIKRGTDIGEKGKKDDGANFGNEAKKNFEPIIITFCLVARMKLRQRVAFQKNIHLS